METKASYVAVGAFVFALVAGAVVFVIWLARYQGQLEYAYYDILIPGSVTGLQVDGTVLTVEGGREESRDGRVTSSRFRRRWDLGFEIDPDTVTATYEAGVLTVEVPRPDAEETKARRIPIARGETKSLTTSTETEAAEAAEEKEVATA